MYKKIVIDGTETNYSVSDSGEIRNDTTGKFLKVTDKGTVQIQVNGKGTNRRVARIVATAFIPNPNNYEYVIYINGNSTDNRIENLKWISKEENGQRTWAKRRENGTTCAGTIREKKKRENIVDLESVEYELNNDEKQVIIDGIKTPYSISTDGKLKNLNNNKYLKGTILNTYHVYKLRVNGQQKNIAAHRLVALMFIPNPENKSYVDHINGDRTDNRVENLRWATREENANNLHKDTIYSIKGKTNYSMSIKNLENEKWQQLLNSEIYVSNYGRVKNISTNKIIKGSIRTDGYHQVKLLSLENKAILTHRLVWEVFNGKIPENMLINHKNGIKNDNRLENLELVTHQENMKKAAEETNAWNFREVGEFDDDGNLLRRFINASAAAREIGIQSGSMRNTIRRNGKCYNGLRYKYLDN